MAKGKAKFRKDQVVMVHSSCFGAYPVKLAKRTRIGTRPNTPAWLDTHYNVEYEEEFRPLTQKEKGGGE